ncbi:ThiF family adenylyltransferase [Streptomyces sp. NPDC092296]|uniref:ThiF family adenylyltransferase n=1 Tax=Streptomyces sp. NPDC092296 TaxID=3366012 RepID=UPI0037FC5F58
MIRPMLKTALPRTWRDRSALQFGAVAERATVLDGVEPEVSAFLDLVDGSRETARLVAEGERLGLGPGQPLELLASLARAGLLDDAGAQQALGPLPGRHRERLAPDLASLSLVHPEPGAAPGLLADRAAAMVRVHGAGRVGAAVAALLTAAGVGRVEVCDGGRVTAADCSPAGIPPQDVGRLRSTAVREAMHRAGGGPQARSADEGRPPDVVVLAPRDGSAGLAVDPGQGQELMRAGVPHLYTGVVEHLGLVGPLVLPGAAACGSCVSLHRGDRDPAWPRLVAQLCSDGAARARTPACDTAVAAAVAGLAALHVLTLLGGFRPPSVDGLLEVSAADGMVRRLRMPLHPECGCAWYSGGSSVGGGGAGGGGAGGGGGGGHARGPAGAAEVAGTMARGRLSATAREPGGQVPGRPV